MFWDGTRWIDERTTTTTPAQPIRRARRIHVPVLSGLLTLALVAVFVGQVSGAFGSGSLGDSSAVGAKRSWIEGQAVAGLRVTLHAVGLGANRAYLLVWDGRAKARRMIRTGGTGNATDGFRIPPLAKSGHHTLTLMRIRPDDADRFERTGTKQPMITSDAVAAERLTVTVTTQSTNPTKVHGKSGQPRGAQVPPPPTPTPGVTATPDASPTPTPDATATPAPTAAPTADPTASPTEPTTPGPTAQPTPAPTATAAPTSAPTATPTATPRPTSTPAPTAAPTATPAPTPTPPPSGTWFGGADPWAGMAFGSFPNAPAGQMWISGDQGGRTISRLTFRDRPAGQNVIVLDGVSNLKIDLIDFDTVPEGIYIWNSHDVEIGRIRARNIFGPYTRTGFHSGNLIQAVNSKRLHIHDLKVDQPDTVPAGYSAWGTEDVISLGGDPGAWGGDSWTAPFLVERFAIDGGAWQSPSGTGIFVGDGASGNYVWIRDGILLNPGQVGIGTGEEGPYRFENISIKGSRGNNGIQLRTSRAEFGGMKVQWPGVPLSTNGNTYTTTAANDWSTVLNVLVAL